MYEYTVGKLKDLIANLPDDTQVMTFDDHTGIIYPVFSLSHEQVYGDDQIEIYDPDYPEDYEDADLDDLRSVLMVRT